MKLRHTLALAACLLLAGGAHAQADTAALQAAQRQAMLPLAALDGTWRGTARVALEGGRVKELVQTERIGSMLGGTLKVIEGRGYAADGQLDFHAFAVVSFSPRTGKYNFHSHAQGQSGDFAFEPRPDGFVWTIKYGHVIIRQTAVIKDGNWNEIGERLVEGQPPVKTVELNLRRVADTDWPAAGAVPMR
jgi:hypothetical protein